MTAADIRAVFLAGAALLIAVLGEVAYPEVYLVAGLVLMATAMWSAHAEVGLLMADEKIGLVFLMWGLGAVAASSGNLLASKTTMASWGAAWLIWVVVSRAGLQGKRVVGFLLLGGGGLAVSGLMAEYSGSLIPRVGGLAENPNITVALIAPVAPLAFVVLGRRSWATAVALLLSTSIFLTGSRAGAIAVALMVVILCPPGRWRKVVLSFGGLLVASALIWRFIANPEPLAWHRWYIWRAVLDLIRDNPLWGIGAGDFGEAAGPYRLAHPGGIGVWGHVIGAAESMILGLAARVGIPGLLFALAWSALWLGRFRYFSRSVVAAIGAICAMGVFHDFLAEPAVLWWWAVVFGFMTPRFHRRPADTLRASNWIRLSGALAIGGLSAWALVQPVLAEVIGRSGPATSHLIGRVVRVEPWYGEALAWRLEGLLQSPEWNWEDVGEALDLSHRLVQVTPGAASAWNLRASVSARLVEEFGLSKSTLIEGREAYRRAQNLEPHLPWYPYRWALMERRIGNLQRARLLTLCAVENEPSFVRGWLLMARLELDRGDLEAARRAFERARAEIARGTGVVKSAYDIDLLMAPERQIITLERELQE